MFATMTSKGRLTLPKEIRDQLGLTAGSRLDISIDGQGLLVGRSMTTTALALARALHRPGLEPVTILAMNEAVENMAAELNPREKR